ncbi:helix-turn-helix domain-containing protein [Streptomyces goshikiensis]|uniref:helix-turn-helix domain-containing protein n=1 Tax=Streptomyces goshikiensis TaxID=1942 RepID=UPI003688B1AF
MTDAQRAVLEGWLRRRSTAQALAQRSRIVLECAEGHSVMEVSRRLGIAPDTVRAWRRRFLEHGLLEADLGPLPPGTAWTDMLDRAALVFLDAGL